MKHADPSSTIKESVMSEKRDEVQETETSETAVETMANEGGVESTLDVDEMDTTMLAEKRMHERGPQVVIGWPCQYVATEADKPEALPGTLVAATIIAVREDGRVDMAVVFASGKTAVRRGLSVGAWQSL